MKRILLLSIILVFVISTFSFASLFSKNFSVSISENKINSLAAQYVIPNLKPIQVEGYTVKILSYQASIDDGKVQTQVKAQVEINGESVQISYQQVQYVYYADGKLNFLTQSISFDNTSNSNISLVVKGMLNQGLSSLIASGKLNYSIPVKTEFNLSLFSRTFGKITLTGFSVDNGSIRLTGMVHLF